MDTYITLVGQKIRKIKLKFEVKYFQKYKFIIFKGQAMCHRQKWVLIEEKCV